MFMVLLGFAALLLCFYFKMHVQSSRRQRREGRQSLDGLQKVLDAYRCGDYESGLVLVEGLKEGPANAEYCYFRGRMLYQLGQFKDAEGTLREALSLEKDKRRVALAQEALGGVLVELERYKEAIDCFETSAHLWSDRTCAHQAIAEALLRRGGASAEALAKARRGANIDHSTQSMSSEIHNLNWSEALATLAWAVAEHSEDASEVERLLAEALPLCGNESRPVRAQLYYHAGRAYAALGQREKSTRHFEQAAGIDPHGNYGRLARDRASLMAVA